MMRNTYVYILVMAAVSILIRTMPLTLIRRPIKNRIIRSFLYYVPYVTLAVMTFPAILDATGSPAAGGCALIVGMIFAWRGAGLFPTAIAATGTVLLLEVFI
jgi:branched-subunit amino acid transport protein